MYNVASKPYPQRCLGDCVLTMGGPADDAYGDVAIKLLRTALANSSEMFANMVGDRRGAATHEPLIFSKDKMDVCVLDGDARSAATSR